MEIDGLNHKVIKRIVILAVIVLHLQELFSHNQEKHQILLAFNYFLKPKDILLNMGQ